MIYIITEILLLVSCIGCVIWSNHTKSKTHEIISTTIAFMCLAFFFIVIGFIVALPERDTADAAKIEVSETEQEQILEVVPIETSANITVTTESLTNEQLIKMFIEKWDGVLPDTINITIGGSVDELS